MGIQVFCNGCEKQLNLDDRFAGKKVKCKKCGGVLAVPAAPTATPRTVAAGVGRPASVPRPAARPAGHRPPPPPPPPARRDDDLDDPPSLDDLASLPAPDVKPIVVPAQPQVYAPGKAAGIARSVGGGTLTVAKKLMFFDVKKVIGYGLVLFLIVGTTAKLYRAYTKISGNDPLAEALNESKAPKLTAVATVPQRPTMLPAGPNAVAGQVTLTNRTGVATTVKVYLPPGNYAARSLPCVLIAPAGSMCITGLPLTSEDTAEHLPYVHDGFAVVAYSLSGGFQGGPNANRKGLKNTAEQFHAAGGGTIDAQDALAFALARFPEIHPDFIVAAGHSSAATHALMLSHKEPRIKAVAAYSPALNLQERFGSDVSVLKRDLPSIGKWLNEYSADKLGTPRCPIMIFHARDDDNTPFSDSESYAGRYPSQITLEAANSGGHSDAMLSAGVPAGIRFFRSKVAGMPPKPTPLPAGAPPVATPAVAKPAAAAAVTIQPMPAPPTDRVAIRIRNNVVEYDGVQIEITPAIGMKASTVSTANNQVRMSWRTTQLHLTVIITRSFGGNGQWTTTEIPQTAVMQPTIPPYRANFDRVGDGVHIRIEASARARTPIDVGHCEAVRDSIRVTR